MKTSKRSINVVKIRKGVNKPMLVEQRTYFKALMAASSLQWGHQEVTGALGIGHLQETKQRNELAFISKSCTSQKHFVFL